MYVLYIKTSCPFCLDAVELLEKYRQPYKTVILDHAPDVWEALKEAYEWPTVPMIFSREEKFSVLVGGYSDLEGYLVSDEQ